MGVIKPIKLLMLSFIIWLFIYVQMPVQYLYNGSAFYPILTLILFISFFIFGTHSLKTNSIKNVEKDSSKKVEQIITILFLIGLFGVLLKVYVGIFSTGIFSSSNVFEQRLENMGKEMTGGVIGIIASLFYPFSFVSLLIGVYNYKHINKWFLAIITIVGLYPFVETFFMGGRTTIALLGTTLLFVMYASFYKNSTAPLFKFKLLKKTLVSIPKLFFKKKVFIPLLIIVVLFSTYSTAVVTKRLNRFGYKDNIFLVWEQTDYQWVKFDTDFKVKYFNASQEEKNKMIGFYSLKHYFVHGVIEYVRLVNDLDHTMGYYYGQYEFNVFFKFFRAIGIPFKTSEELNEIVTRGAVYQTFWGPFYIDFGLVGIVIMFFWGRFVKRIYTHAKRGSTPHVIFYGYLATILITSFFINFLLGSSSYYLFAFFVTLFIFKYWPNNLKFVIKNE